MDKALAKYLYANETLYSFSQATIKEEPVAPVEVKDTSPAKPVEVIKEAPPSTLIEVQATTNNEEAEQERKEVKVYEMKTPHLLVFQQLSDTDREFLLKIVQALGLSFTKVDLLELKDYPFLDFKETIYTNKVQSILFFGKHGDTAFIDKLKLEPYQEKEIKNINFLLVDELKTVSANKNNEKRKLWGKLQVLFS